MPPRRSSRAAAPAKPQSKPEPAKPAAKATAKAPAKPRGRNVKRPADDDAESRTPSPAPAPKRRRAGSKAPNGVAAPKHKDQEPEKENEKKAEKKVEKPSKSVEKKEKKPAKVVQQKPYFNPLPSPPDHHRPAPQLFVWGAGNFGQFGMGEDALGEFEKPQRNKLVEQKSEDGEFGEEGAGLETVAAGGMYSLLIDEKGTVRTFLLYVGPVRLISRDTDMVMWYQRRCCSWSHHHRCTQPRERRGIPRYRYPYLSAVPSQDPSR